MNQTQRLGKNINGYFGERIDIQTVLHDCCGAAEAHGWTWEQIRVAGKQAMPALLRPPQPIESTHDTRPALRVYISAGIHGDEPAGPLAVRQLLQANQWPGNPALWICPCLNPTGFVLGRRENAEGADLNRQYLHPQAEETRAHIGWLESQPRFDLCLCLHEDWEAHGFYVYELNPDDQPSLAPAIVAGVAQDCPIDPSEVIEGRPAREGIIRPSVDPRSRPQWPESFFLLTNKTRLSYTLEAPSDFLLQTRVTALVNGVRSALEELRIRRGPK